MFSISKPMVEKGKLVPFLKSAGEIFPETGLIFKGTN
jgi:hypothetical protein